MPDPLPTFHGTVLDDDPAVYWTLDETTGATAADASGNGNVGSIGDGVSLGEDPAIAVEGGHSASSGSAPGPLVTGAVPGAPGPTPTGAIELWTRPAEASSDTAGPPALLPLAAWGDAGIWQFGPFVVARSTDTGPASLYMLALDTDWHHLVLSWDGDAAVLYIDGQAVPAYVPDPDKGPIPFEFPSSSSDLSVGGGAEASFDEVTAYAHPLSREQVRTHWMHAIVPERDCTAEAPGDGRYLTAVLDDQPLQYVRLGGSGTRAPPDISGNCVDVASGSAISPQSPGAIDGDSDQGSSVGPNFTNSFYSSSAALLFGSLDRDPDADTASFEFWFKAPPSHHDGPIATMDGSYVVYGHSTGSSGPLITFGDSTRHVDAAAPEIEDGGWHQVAVTESTSVGISIYIDGRQRATLPVVAQPETGSYLETAGSLVMWGSTGGIDEVSRYDAALTPAKINAHFTLGASQSDEACVSAPTTGYGHLVGSAGPTLYFRLSDRAADPNSRVAFDRSGNCRNAPLTVAPGDPAPSVAGPAESALVDDSDGATATDDEGDWLPIVSPPFAHTAGGDRTFEGWIRQPDDALPRQLVSFADGLSIALEEGHVRLSAEADSTDLSTAIPLGDDDWHLVDVVVDNGVATLFVDGEPQDSGPAPDDDTTASDEMRLALARGDLDEVALYPRALTGQEIRSHWGIGALVQSTTLLATSAKPWTGSEPITLTATVASANEGHGSPGGDVTFTDRGHLLGTAAIEGTTAVYVVAEPADGFHSFAAAYDGDDLFAPSHSSPIAGAVTTPGGVVLQVDRRATYGSPVTVTATITPLETPSDPADSGTVTYFDGATQIGQGDVEDGQAQLVVDDLEPGDHALTAHFSGGGDYDSAVSPSQLLTVDPAPTTTRLHGPAHAWSYPAQSIDFDTTVLVADPSLTPPAGSVQAKVDGTSIGDPVEVGSNGHATVTIPASLTTGAHNVTATFTPEDVARQSPSTSAGVRHTRLVKATVEMSSDLSGGDLVAGQTVTLHTSVSTTVDDPPSGLLVLRRNGVVEREVPFGADAATDIAMPLHTGTNHFIATWYPAVGGVTCGYQHLFTTPACTPQAPGVSAPIDLSATIVGTTTSITTTSAIEVVGGVRRTNVAVTVAPDAPSTSHPNGYVSIYLDNATNPVDTWQLTDGELNATITAPKGSHTIRAVYGGTDDYDQSEHATEPFDSKWATNLTRGMDPAAPSSTDSTTLTATIHRTSPATGDITGTVTFTAHTTFDDETSTHSWTAEPDPDTGIATVEEIHLPTGSNVITFAYAGDDDNDPATSTTPEPLEVANGAVEVHLSLATTAKVGEPVTATVTVSASDGAGEPPAGVITFHTTQSTGATGNLPFTPGETVQLDGITWLMPGEHTLTARYTSTSGTSTTLDHATITIGKADTATEIIHAKVVHRTLTIDAHITSALDVGEGEVTFTDDGALIGTDADLDHGVAHLTIEDVVPGSVHHLIANFSGTTRFESSVSDPPITVTAPLLAALDVSTSTDEAVWGQPVTVTVTVTPEDPNAPVPHGTITAHSSTTSVSGTLEAAATGNSATFHRTVSNFPTGTHAVTADYDATAPFEDLTGTADLDIDKASFTLETTADLASTEPGEPFVIRAIATPDEPSVLPATGTVYFSTTSDESGETTYLGARDFDSHGVATFNVTPSYAETLPGGNQHIVATFHTNNHYESTSDDVAHIVQRDGTDITGATELEGAYSQDLQFDVSIASTRAGDQGPFVPTGTVAITEGNDFEHPITSGTIHGATEATATLILDDLNVGTHTLDVSYGGDDHFEPSSYPLTVTVTRAWSTTTIETSDCLIANGCDQPEPVAVGDTATFIAHVHSVVPANGNPTGTVTFTEGANVLGRIDVTDGTATITLSDLHHGRKSVRARFNGSTGFGQSQSPIIVQKILHSSTVTISPATASTVYGQSAEFDVTVTATDPSSDLPTGPVRLVSTSEGQETTVAEVQLDTHGRAHIKAPVGTPRVHSLQVHYGGDTVFAADDSPTFSHTVRVAGSTVAVIPTPNPSGEDSDVELLITVVAATPGKGVPTGFVTVTIDDDETEAPITATLTAAEPGAQAEMQLPRLDAGDHSVRLDYGGDTNFDDSSFTYTQTVRPAAEVSVTQDTESAPLGTEVTFSAHVAPFVDGVNGTPTGELTWYIDNEPIQSDTLSTDSGDPFLTTSQLSGGDHDITAKYEGDNIFRPAASNPVTHTVESIATTTSLTEISTGPYVSGQDATFSITVATVDDSEWVPKGRVQLYVDDEPVGGERNLIEGAASINGIRLTTGTNHLTATFSPSAGFISSGTVSPVVIEATKADATVSVSSSAAPASAGAPLTLTAQVSFASPGHGTPHGTITFAEEDATEPLSEPIEVVVDPISYGGDPTDYLATATATLDLPDGLDLGIHHITATYSDDLEANETTGTLTQTVRNASQITITGPSEPTELGITAAFDITVTSDDEAITDGPAGTVRLLAGGEVLDATSIDGTDELASVQLETELLPPGDPTVTAEYIPASDSPYGIGRAMTTHHVIKGTVDIAVATSATVRRDGQNVTLTALVAPVAPANRAITGQVEFTANGWRALGSSQVVNGVATLTIDTGLSIGPGTAEAKFLGDDSYEESDRSEPVDITTRDALQLAISASATSGVAPFEAQFTLDSNLGDNPHYQWDFGDGSASDDDQGAQSHIFDNPGIYTVQLLANADDGDQANDSVQIRVSSADGPLADAGDDQVISAGGTVSFDGAGSTPLFGIETWTWHYGDGGTGPTSGQDPARPTHRYDSPGTYTATLTVTPYDGAPVHDTVRITVTAPTIDRALKVKVTGQTPTGPKTIANATVTVVDQIRGRHSARTDAQGWARLEGLADHTYSVNAIAEGFQPVHSTVVVSHGYGTKIMPALVAGPLVDVTVDSHPVDPEDYADLGIDPLDAGNNEITEFEIHLPELPPIIIIKDEPDSYRPCGGSCSVPAGCDIVIGWEMGTIAAEGTHKSVLSCRVRGPQWEAWVVVTIEHGIVTALVAQGAAWYLRDVTQVQMTVVNLTSPDFAFTHGKASLNLPAGLQLAVSEPVQTVTRNVANIIGGQQQTMTWNVVGAEAGDWPLSATYSSMLYPFDQPISTTAALKDPIHVAGREALRVHATADNRADKAWPFRVDVAVTNTSDAIAKNVTVAFDVGGSVFQPRQDLLTVVPELGPHETLSVPELRLVPDHDVNQFDPERSVVTWTAGLKSGTDAVTFRDPEGSVDRRLAPTLRDPDDDADEKDPNAEVEDDYAQVGTWGLNFDPAPGGAVDHYELYVASDPQSQFDTKPAKVTWPGNDTPTTTIPASVGTIRYDAGVKYRNHPGTFASLALRTVYADGTAKMVHNAVEAASRSKATAVVDNVVVDCKPAVLTDDDIDDPGDAGDSELEITAHSEFNPIEVVHIYRFKLTATPENLKKAEKPENWDDPVDITPGNETYGNGFTGNSFSGEIDLHYFIPGVIQVGTGVLIAVSVDDGHGESSKQPMIIAGFHCQHRIRLNAALEFGGGCNAERYYVLARMMNQEQGQCHIDPVNSATGTLTESRTDATMAGAGHPFTFERWYNSADDTVGDLGRGWTHSYADTLTVNEDDSISYRSGTGQVLDFAANPEDQDTYIPPPGIHSTLTRDPLHPEAGYRVTDADYSYRTFDVDGVLQSVLDSNGLGVTLHHDEDGRLDSATDAEDREITFEYDGDRLQQVNIPGPDGGTRELTYDFTNDGLLHHATSMAGFVSTYRYEDSLLVEETDGNPKVGGGGNKRTHLTHYDATTGRVDWQQDGLGNVSHFDWDPETETSTITDATGREWVEHYRDNVLISELHPDGRQYTYAYDADLNVTQLTDSLVKVTDDPNSEAVTVTALRPSRVTTMTFDGDGRMMSRILPDATGETFTYQGNKVKTHTDLAGNLTTYTYDNLYRTTQIDAPGGRTSTFGYDSRGRLIEAGDALGHHVTLRYDDADNLTCTVTPLGYTTVYDHDQVGRVTQSIDPRGTDQADGTIDDECDIANADVTFATDSDFDDDDHLTDVTTPAGADSTRTHTHTEVNALGNPKTVTSTGSPTITYTYTNAEELDTKKVGNHPETDYDYDDRGSLQSETTPEQLKTWYEQDANGRVEWVHEPGDTNATPIRWHYEHDGDGNITRITDPAGNSTRFTFDVLNRERSRIDERTGFETDTAYDAAGNVASVTTIDKDSAIEQPTQTTSYAYDAAGDLLTTTDYLGHQTVNTYDAVGHLTSTTTPMGETTRFGWDPDGRQTVLIDPRSTGTGDAATYQTVTTYDAAGNISSVTNSEGHRMAFTYDPAGDLVDTEDQRHNHTSIRYDNLHRQTSLVRPGDVTTITDYDDESSLVTTSGDNRPTVKEWRDHDGRLATRSVEAGGETHTWQYEYDLKGNLHRTISPEVDDNGMPVPEAQRTTTVDHDKLHHVSKITDPASRVTESTYDHRGLLAHRVAPDGGETTLTYSPGGRLTSTLDPRGYTTYVTYDHDTYSDDTEVTRVNVSVPDPADHPSLTVHTDGLARTISDPDGRTWKTTSHERRPIIYGYDAAGNKTSITDGEGGQTRTTWTAENRLQSVTDPTDGKTTYGYDAAGHLTSVEDPNGGVTGYHYDERGNRVDRVADDGSVQAWVWDDNDRLIEATDQLNQTTTFHYDAFGRNDRIVDPSGRQIDNGFDSHDRVVTTDFTHGTDAIHNAYRYNPDDELLAASSGDDRITYSRDAMGHPATVATYSGAELRNSVSAHWDLAGNRDRLDYPGDSTALNYAYDGNNQLVGMSGTTPNVATIVIGRDRDGLFKTEYVAENDAAPMWVHADWDRAGRPRSRSQEMSGDDRTDTLTYDAAGRILSDHLVQRTPMTTVQDTNFAYDPAGQLLEAVTTDEDEHVIRSHSYTYDSVGNKIADNGNEADDTWSFDSAHQVTQMHVKTVHSDSFGPAADPGTDGTELTIGFDYDEAGRRTAAHAASDTELEYSYDARGKLATGTQSSGGTQYAAEVRTYDPDGLMSSTTMNPDPSIGYVQAQFAWDRTQQVPQIISENIGGYQINLGYSDRRLGFSSPDWAAGTPADVFGNTVGGYGGFASGENYDPYGFPDASFIGHPSLGFKSEFQSTIGLVYLRNRDYDPLTGVFTTRDPLDGINGTPTVSNPYAYASNDPINNHDPLGLRSDPWNQKCQDSWCITYHFARGEAKALVGAVSGLARLGCRFHLLGIAGMIPGTCSVVNAVDKWSKTYAPGASYEWERKGATTMKVIILIAPLVAGPIMGALKSGVARIGAAGAAEAGAAGAEVGSEIIVDELTEELSTELDILGDAGVDPGFDPAEPGFEAPSGPEVEPVSPDEPVQVDTKPETSNPETEPVEEPTGCGGRSFSADTPVLMADGRTKAISEIRVGDKVLATDPITGRTGPRRVTATMVNDDYDLRDLVVTDEQGRASIIHTTSRHLVWDATDERWVPVGSLTQGHRLRRPDGTTVLITAVQTVRGHQSMLDLTIADTHTFYVGFHLALAHNVDVLDRCPGSAGGRSPRVFWSGGQPAEEAATQFASEIGGETIGMTPAGRDAAAAAEGLPWEGGQRQIWEDASETFARGASGEVHVFISGQARAGSIWAEKELPALVANQDVTEIIFHLTGIPPS